MPGCFLLPAALGSITASNSAKQSIGCQCHWLSRGWCESERAGLISLLPSRCISSTKVWCDKSKIECTNYTRVKRGRSSFLKIRCFQLWQAPRGNWSMAFFFIAGLHCAGARHIHLCSQSLWHSLLYCRTSPPKGAPHPGFRASNKGREAMERSSLHLHTPSKVIQVGFARTAAQGM